MSDLSRLRRNLADCERRGRRHKADLEMLREEIDAQAEPMTRAQEKAIEHLDGLLAFDRRQWRAIHDRLAAEEKRYLTDPALPFRFT